MDLSFLYWTVSIALLGKVGGIIFLSYCSLFEIILFFLLVVLNICIMWLFRELTFLYIVFCCLSSVFTLIAGTPNLGRGLISLFCLGKSFYYWLVLVVFLPYVIWCGFPTLCDLKYFLNNYFCGIRLFTDQLILDFQLFLIYR